MRAAIITIATRRHGSNVRSVNAASSLAGDNMAKDKGRPSQSDLWPCPHRSDSRCDICIALDRMIFAVRGYLADVVVGGHEQASQWNHKDLKTACDQARRAVAPHQTKLADAKRREAIYQKGK